MDDILAIVAEMEWTIAVPDGDGPVPGLIIGQNEFVCEAVNLIYGGLAEVYYQDPAKSDLTKVAEPKAVDELNMDGGKDEPSNRDEDDPTYH